MKKKNTLLFVSFSFLFSLSLTWGKESVSRVMYFNQIFGNIHKSPLRYSQYLSTIECNHPVKVLKNEKGEIGEREFLKVVVGPYTGYIHRLSLSGKKKRCFSSLYPKFFDALNLKIVDTFYWGKLNDQYIQGRSRAR